MWRRTLRLALLVTLAILALSEGSGLVRSFDRIHHLRTDMVDGVRTTIDRLRPALEAARMRRGSLETVRTLRSGVPLALAGEAELLDPRGERLAVFPAPAPVEHALDEAQRRALDEDAIISVGPVAGKAVRLLTYARMRCCNEYLRLATPAEHLVAALREQRLAMAGQLVRLAALVLIAFLALLPERAPPVVPPAGALLAYQEALTRLKAGRAEELERHEGDLRRMESANRDLESMARAGELTAGVVHEVRNGLATILGNARLLEGRAPDEHARALVAGIREECESLEVVVRRFVEFARRETLAAERFDPRRFLERVIAREGANRGVSVELLHRGDQPVSGDEALLERALENLVRNAREAAGPGGHVEVESLHAPPVWRVQIADDGPGFPAELLEGPPRPFLTKKAGGLGLGLALVSKIVRLHGGALSLRARAPKGALVIVELPSDPQHPGDATVRYAGSPSGSQIE